MAIWYEGNRNNVKNERQQDGITYYIRGVHEVDGVRDNHNAPFTYPNVMDWDDIRAVKNAVGIPVIGNGDIFSPEDVLLMKEQTPICFYY